MSYSFGSAGINDQMVPVAESYFFQPPPGQGPVFHGPGQMPLPTIPGVTAGSASGGSYPVTPLTIALLGASFIVGILILRYIHWRH